jgi:crooked neck
MDKTPAPY